MSKNTDNKSVQRIISEELKKWADKPIEEKMSKWIEEKVKDREIWENRNITTTHLPYYQLVEETCKHYSPVKPIKHNKVDKFSDDMQRELDNNSHKGDWEVWKDIHAIDREYEYHFKKLKTVLQESEDDINFESMLREHIADCANILMFLGNAYNLYD